jgi:ATP-binding cassette, subfamily C (CFTR/MRP), member 1
MRERFSNHTILSIVHKLESALDDFDLVAVLDAGVLVEFGAPRELLQHGADKSPFAALYESLTSQTRDAQHKGADPRGSGSIGDDTISSGP